ncbi:MAG: hypothetical protein Q8R10_08450 [Pseudomonas sp.]|nr:hypothetical protein [Pseudomonas sp.]MDP3846436.1 hypothetical protein [Pseudomonas sp.]
MSSSTVIPEVFSFILALPSAAIMAGDLQARTGQRPPNVIEGEFEHRDF